MGMGVSDVHRPGPGIKYGLHGTGSAALWCIERRARSACKDSWMGYPPIRMVTSRDKLSLLFDTPTAARRLRRQCH